MKVKIILVSFNDPSFSDRFSIFASGVRVGISCYYCIGEYLLFHLSLHNPYLTMVHAWHSRQFLCWKTQK